MMVSYPRIVIYPSKLRHNASSIVSRCADAGVGVTFVGKCVAQDPMVLSCLEDMGFHALADSRTVNLQAAQTHLPKVLLRIGTPEAAEEIVTSSQISLQSEPCTIVALDRAAGKFGLVHKVILMIDLGDLREGILYSDTASILAVAQAVIDAPNLLLHGLGTNLTCYGSVIPDENNLGILCRIAAMIEDHFHISLPVISGGNSSSLSLLFRGKMPSGVNDLRIGEAILLGTDTASGAKFPDLHDDAFILEAVLAEVKEKPSFPIGTRSVDAFGKVREYEDRGIMRRGILAIGRQDTPIDELIPLDDRIRIIGGSSDHLIVDLGQVNAKVGDVLQFKLTYGGLLGAYTSKYVSKYLAE